MITIKELKEHCERQLNKLPKGSKTYEEHLLTLNIIETLKEKDKQIDELVKYIDSNNYVDNEECQFQWDFKIEKCAGNGDCKDCIKQYFERKNEE